jgi:hypothetical protein
MTRADFCGDATYAAWLAHHREANPRLDAMRSEAIRLRHGSGPEGGSMRELRRAAVLEEALRAYRTDAELEAAEREAREAS